LDQSLTVEVIKSVIYRLSDDGILANALIQDGGRNFALAKTWDVYLGRHGLVGLFQGWLEASGVNGNGQLYASWGKALNSGLHFVSMN
jgi:hypothetical protein